MNQLEQIFTYFVNNIQSIQLILMIIGAIAMLLRSAWYLVFFILFDLVLIFEGIFFKDVLILILGVVFLLISISQVKSIYGRN